MELVAARKKRKKKIPDAFIYEIMDGKPLYFKGYKQAIKNNQNPESIMGASSLQVAIIHYLLRILYAAFDENNYWVFSGEPDIHLNHKDNLGGDIMVYDIQHLPASKISEHYLDVPPMLQVEVDIRAEMEDMTETGYIKRKTQKLLDFGAHKVIWVFTAAQQILIATPNQDWVWADWNKTIELLQGATFCIGKYLRQKGIIQEQV
jgi:hypothetical protein